MVSKHVVTLGRGAYGVADSSPLIKQDLDRKCGDPEIPIQQEQNVCARYFPRPYDSDLIWQCQDPVVDRNSCEYVVRSMKTLYEE